MKMVLSLVVLILLSSCGMTNDQWANLSNSLRPLRHINDDIDYPTYTTTQVQPYTRLNSTQSTNYRINTDSGIKHKRCIQLPSGSMYCQ